MEKENEVHLSWYGEVTTKNYDDVVERHRTFKEQRLVLFRRIKEILDRLEVPYWLDCGSLLGAYRRGGMLPHDADFDFSVMGRGNHDKVRPELHKLPPEYDFKDGTANSAKYEVYNRSAGYVKPLGEVMNQEHVEETPGIQNMNVSGDIYLWELSPHDKDLVVLNYTGYGNEQRRYRREWIFPLSTIEFEGMQVPCPNDVESHLKEMYGYIGEDYRYDPSTYRFVKREPDLTARA